MSVAKQVPAKNLCQKIGRETVKKVLQSDAAALFQTAPANIDTISPRLVDRYPSTSISLGGSTDAVIATDAACTISKLLNMTAYQQELLERGTVSITSNQYQRVGGTDAVLTKAPNQDAAVMLHAIGFSRVRGEGSIVNPRFIKALEKESGCVAVAAATIESNGNHTYINLSVDANVSPL